MRKYALVDDRHDSFLDGQVSRFSISRSNGEHLAWVSGDSVVAQELIDALNAPAAAAREFPAMTPELASILGLMCFQCIPFAQALRTAGHQIKTSAEDEQAAVLHWMLGHWFRHGEEWREHAQADMNRMKDAAIAAAKGNGQ